ncbi:hypothetical protein Rxycam_02355 [Rubrobacter xylanophilus DSM 9941]|uniref:hypothetical protein n=1 Tax=Rubrobacter xylanophilus TaxID=49319 RepID=UPI001C63E500|nr:hypothetical protein [Rubrobacter xylanophilus]QYJ16522.1 hypothetical protein Rxycam_02355 [Rubrobacter xylanophilus DSM 9941]
MQGETEGGRSSGLSVEDVVWDASGREVRVSATLGGEELELHYASSERLYPGLDFLVPGLLLPAMRHGEQLSIPGGVSPRLLEATAQIQDVFNIWESVFRKVGIRAERLGTAPANRPAEGVACVFGGGIDSFHTLMRHREEITHLLYLHPQGEDPRARERALRRVREVAKATGKALIEVDTNFRQLSREHRIPWKYAHGPWIASAALLFQHVVGKVFVAGSTTSNYDNLRPQGTHPILDPLWSTERTSFYHDGCEVRRVRKAAEISGFAPAMKWLQVCDRTGGAGNCGGCEKCLRSMLNLQAAGALKRCQTLPDEIDPEAVRALDLTGYSESYFARENLRALKGTPGNEELVRALQDALERGAAIIAHSGYREENLERFRRRIRNLRQENARLKQRLRRQERRRRIRYQIADRIAELFLRIPGARYAAESVAKRLSTAGAKNPPY